MARSLTVVSTKARRAARRDLLSTTSRQLRPSAKRGGYPARLGTTEAMQNARLAAKAAQLHHATGRRNAKGTDMSRLTGKVAVVTGGASGMGRATVMRFLADGAKVVVADLNEANGQETLSVAKAQGHGDDIAFVRCDVANEADVAAMVAEAVRRFGRLDIAYLNAGVGGAFGPIAETSVEDWDYTFAVLVRSVFLGMKHASQAMKKHGGGVILVTASIA